MTNCSYKVCKTSITYKSDLKPQFVLLNIVKLQVTRVTVHDQALTVWLQHNSSPDSILIQLQLCYKNQTRRKLIEPIITTLWKWESVKLTSISRNNYYRVYFTIQCKIFARYFLRMKLKDIWIMMICWLNIGNVPVSRKILEENILAAITKIFPLQNLHQTLDPSSIPSCCNMIHAWLAKKTWCVFYFITTDQTHHLLLSN